MWISTEEFARRAAVYCEPRRLTVRTSLGRGLQGAVFYVASPSSENALKIHARQDGYAREVAVYRRLAKHRVTSVRGLTVPQLLNVDEGLLAFEMSIVKPPYLLDFGGAYLDTIPDHIEREVPRDEDFGEFLREVEAVRAELHQRFGVILADINTGNIRFA
jgi:hypothetical protein